MGGGEWIKNNDCIYIQFTETEVYLPREANYVLGGVKQVYPIHRN